MNFPSKLIEEACQIATWLILELNLEPELTSNEVSVSAREGRPIFIKGNGLANSTPNSRVLASKGRMNATKVNKN